MVVFRVFSLVAFDIGAKHSSLMLGVRLAEGRIREVHPDSCFCVRFQDFSLIKWLLLATGQQSPTIIIMTVILVGSIRLADRVYP